MTHRKAIASFLLVVLFGSFVCAAIYFRLPEGLPQIGTVAGLLVHAVVWIAFLAFGVIAVGIFRWYGDASPVDASAIDRLPGIAAFLLYGVILIEAPTSWNRGVLMAIVAGSWLLFARHRKRTARANEPESTSVSN